MIGEGVVAGEVAAGGGVGGGGQGAVVTGSGLVEQQLGLGQASTRGEPGAVQHAREDRVAGVGAGLVSGRGRSLCAVAAATVGPGLSLHGCHLREKERERE